MVDEMYDQLDVIKFESEAKTFLEALNLSGIKVESISHGELDHEARTIEVKLYIP
tara:strand:- start:948 stop:1112 length:165 start_codon:yes stop_codon:yes gene_type:complete